MKELYRKGGAKVADYVMVTLFHLMAYVIAIAMLFSALLTSSHLLLLMLLRKVKTSSITR